MTYPGMPSDELREFNVAYYREMGPHRLHWCWTEDKSSPWHSPKICVACLQAECAELRAELEALKGKVT